MLMRYRKLADTDVTLSEVGFGVWTVAAGWWGEFSDDQAADLLRRALDLGVTFFDTGDTYGNGRGETILAKAFGGQRDKVVIGTKFGYDFYTNPDLNRGQRERPHDWSPKFVRFALEQSLKRLETDYIDLWMLHNPRMDAIQKDDLFALLDDLKAEGKIRAYGASLDRPSPAPSTATRRSRLASSMPSRSSSTCWNRTPAAASSRSRVSATSGSSSGYRTPRACWKASTPRRRRFRRATTAATGPAPG